MCNDSWSGGLPGGLSVMGSVAKSVGDSRVANRMWCFQGQDKWSCLIYSKSLYIFKL